MNPEHQTNPADVLRQVSPTLAGRLVESVMTPVPAQVAPGTTLTETARLMRDLDIGSVLVSDGGHLVGLVTDRDLVVRGLAEESSAAADEVGALCSERLVTVAPDDTLDDAAQLMRDAAVRRLPVVSDGMAVGVVSLGDLALAQEPDSGLASISGAQPNR